MKLAGLPSPDGHADPPAGVEFLGRLDEKEMTAAYASAGVYCLPAVYEPFGLTPLEAARGGCPLVLGDVPSLREVWGDAAAFVPPRNPDALAGTLNRLIADPAECTRLAAAAGEAGAAVHPGRDDRRLPRPLSQTVRVARPVAAGRPGTRLGGGGLMRLVVFTHSVVSDWNHGNAHFLRGVLQALQERGHTTETFEPSDGWSLQNLLGDHGLAAAVDFAEHFPDLPAKFYDPTYERFDGEPLEAVLDRADAVLVHEWNHPDFVARLGRKRRDRGDFTLLFHDTHHRAATAPAEMARFDLSNYDGVFAFGRVIEDIYRRERWHDRVWTWHEAADASVFTPPPLPVEKDRDLVWVGNWGDGERTAELGQFLLGPVRELGLNARVHGVRYPAEAREALRAAGCEYAGWLPNHRVPRAFSEARVTVHVPRGPYVAKLPGVPTIRPFEALACGLPLVCSPWDDAEGLFTPGRDFLTAADGAEMKTQLRRVLNDGTLAAGLVEHGRETVLAKHTCGHRADELLTILGELGTRDL